MRSWRALALLWLFATAASAQSQVVIYRCTDGNGAVTIQNDIPCPKGSKQSRRVLDATLPSYAPPPFAAPAPPPAPSPSPVPVAPEPARTTPAKVEPAQIADADRLPPPALYECRTYDNGRYLSDDGQPPPRCAPLQVSGLDGSSERAAGAACQMVQDQCQRIPDGALCEQWQQRLREAQSQLRFGVVEQRERAQAEVERMQRIVRESTCGK